MTRITMPRLIADTIAVRIATFSREANNQFLWLAPFVAEFSALPLYVGWVETIGIRSNGEIISWSTEGEYSGVRPVQDQILVLNSIVDGSQKYPELQQLLPKRVEGATDCLCLGVPLLASHRVFCGDCGGLGWIPPEDRKWVGRSTTLDHNRPNTSP